VYVGVQGVTIHFAALVKPLQVHAYGTKSHP
jgi:hypothetical protein